MTPLALVPPPEPLQGQALEDAARAEMCRALGLVVSVSAPTWRELMFAGKPIDFKVPEVPPKVAGKIGVLTPTDFAADQVGLAALLLAEKLQKTKPAGSFRRSVVPGKPLPIAHGDAADWERAVFLTATGPGVVPLLCAAGYLTGGDVETLGVTYHDGMEAQRMAAIEAATALMQASARSGHDPELPDWLNEQMLTLMNEERPTDVFQAIYAKATPPPGKGPAASGVRSGIAQSFRPTPGTGDSNP
jgi:hypothetical protein